MGTAKWRRAVGLFFGVLGTLRCAHHAPDSAAAGSAAESARDAAARQAVVTARKIVDDHVPEVEQCFRTAEGYGPVTVSKTRIFEAVLLGPIGLPVPPTDDPVPVYALIKCIRDVAVTWGLPISEGNPGVAVLFFLRPTALDGSRDDPRSAKARTLVKTDTSVLSFNAGVFRWPRKISGPDPQFDAASVKKRTSGEMKIKCTLTVRGVLRDCQVLRAVPGLNGPTLRALEARRYSPASWNDEPIEVDYNFNITFYAAF